MSSIKEKFEKFHKAKYVNYDYTKDDDNHYLDFEVSYQYNIYLTGYNDGLSFAAEVYGKII